MNEVRLVDANALRERLLVIRNSITNVQCISDIFDICLTEVSNAPTVEGYKNVIVGGMNNPYNAGYMDGIRQAYKELERPQGEWIDYDNTFYKCPECGYLLEKCCPQCQNKVILPKGGAE